MMIFINGVYKEDVLPKEFAEGFVKLLNPVCPFITEELWEMLGHTETIANETWPTYDEAKTMDEEIEIPVQVNGKVSGCCRCSRIDGRAESSGHRELYPR